jgi:hypothetical protein
MDMNYLLGTCKRSTILAMLATLIRPLADNRPELRNENGCCSQSLLDLAFSGAAFLLQLLQQLAIDVALPSTAGDGGAPASRRTSSLSTRR